MSGPARKPVSWGQALLLLAGGAFLGVCAWSYLTETFLPLVERGGIGRGLLSLLGLALIPVGLGILILGAVMALVSVSRTMEDEGMARDVAAVQALPLTEGWGLRLRNLVRVLRALTPGCLVALLAFLFFYLAGRWID